MPPLASATAAHRHGGKLKLPSKGQSSEDNIPALPKCEPQQVGNPYDHLAEGALPRHADSPHFRLQNYQVLNDMMERLSTQERPGVHNSKNRKLEIRANTYTEVNLACLADSSGLRCTYETGLFC
ncbi:unnamed protein product [Bubo scandiacus]